MSKKHPTCDISYVSMSEDLATLANMQILHYEG